MATLGDVLRQRREEHGLTVDEVAVIARVSKVQVRAYEAGWATPYPKTVKRLAAVLSLPAAELLELRRTAARKR